MKFSAFLQRQSKPMLLFEAILLVLFTGTMDWCSGYEMSMSLFYGAPILWAIWFCDRKSGLLIAILCGITWWWADILAGHLYPTIWLSVWEPAARFVYFGFVAVGGAALKEKHDSVQTRIELLEHSQQLEREIIEISEREQRRIGRDLHDGLCQYFAAIGCGVASLRSDLLQRDLPDEAEKAAELADLVNNGVVQARELARGLVPVHMGGDGLGAALQELASSVTRLHEIDCVFEAEGEAAVSGPSAATHLYRIAQEAINNATRHGRAQRVRIELHGAGDSGTLRITDNGAGMAERPSSEGLGLSIMSYRARLVGGNLAISRPAEGGTMITCVFPQQREAFQPPSALAA